MLQTTRKIAPFLVLLLQLWASRLVISASYERHPVNDLIEHAISNGAVVSPKLVFRDEDDGDIANGTKTVSIDRKPAVVARNDVARGEILVSVPSELCLRASDDDDDVGEGYQPYCRILRTLVDDMYDDSNSRSPPHARYLASLPRNVNPALWSDGAIDLLNEMVGTRLPPFNLKPFRENLDGFLETSSCGDAFPELFDDNEEEEETHQIEELLWHARHVGLTRAEYEAEGGDLVVIPVIDMMTHRNGRWRNADFVNNAFDEEEGTLYDGGTYDVVARRDIKAGERIYLSFELSTVEMLEQHGVVESYPQKWDIGNGVAFDIDEATGESSNDKEKGKLIVKFHQRPTERSNSFLREEIMRLQDFKKAAPSKSANIPSAELDMVWAYYDALITALMHAHDSAVDVVGGDKLTVTADLKENQTDKEKGGCEEGDESCPSGLGSQPPKLSLSGQAAELIKHVTAHGAVVSPKLLFRDEDEHDSKNGLKTVSIDRRPAIVAREDINRGEVVVSVPSGLVLRARDDVDGQPDCRILRTLVDEMSGISGVDSDLGRSSSSSPSSSSPHARYLASLPRDVNPSLWSDEAIDLLKEMVGKRLPPFDLHPFRGDLDGFLEQAWCEDTFPELTGPDGDRVEELLWHVRHLTMTRFELEGEDLVGIPVVDMMTHRNGRWRNADFVNNNAYDEEEGTVVDGGTYEIVARRDIKAGERIYISFEVSTVELFSQYGVIESYPQSWDIGNGVAFDIDEATEEGEEGRLVVKFRQRPSKRSKAFIRGELVRLKHFKRGAQQSVSIPPAEWDMVWAYYDALVVALTHAHDAAVDVIGGDKLTSQS